MVIGSVGCHVWSKKNIASYDMYMFAVAVGVLTSLASTGVLIESRLDWSLAKVSGVYSRHYWLLQVWTDPVSDNWILNQYSKI
jgi:hypothetical protein